MNHNRKFVAAGIRYSEAVANARSAAAAHTEADEAARLASCDAIDLEAADREAHLNEPSDSGSCMGFTGGTNQSGPVDLDASGRASVKGNIAFEHARAEAMRTEVAAVKATREAEAAEVDLLAVAADLTPVDRPVEPARPAVQSAQPAPAPPVQNGINEEAA